jgi:fatty-acid peroxygenase
VTDLAIALLRRGYDALPDLWSGSTSASDDLVRTRLLGRPALVVRGPDGARLFYDDTLVERSGVVPAPLGHLLFGKGAVHGLDGAEHRVRKAMFVDVLTPARVEELGCDVATGLDDAVLSWPRREPVRLFDELVRVYGTCVLPWAGVQVGPAEAAAVATRMARIVDGFGFAPRAYAAGWAARVRSDRWAAALVREARTGVRRTADGTMLQALTRGPGRELPLDVAGVELLNVIRPTVAVAWLGAFAALSLVENPGAGRLLGDPDRRTERRHFADEVRRTTPFVPALAGRVRRTASWHGAHLEPGDLVVLDVPATNHYPGTWRGPRAFRPERFGERAPDAFEHVPQGGGDVRQGHRCPGEEIAMTLLDRTLFRLARTGFTLSGEAPDLTRIPTLPRRLLVDAVEPAGAAPSLLVGG